MQTFNVTGTCVPKKHYMVDITGKLEQIKKLIDAEAYFTINRGRQYGKTTTLLALEHFLGDEYTVISISFEGIGEEPFSSEANFCQTFVELISDALRFTSETKEYREVWMAEDITNLKKLSDHITNMCEDKHLVLMIDEVDKSSNNIIFLNFLGKLREKYLLRNAGKDFTFHSVILAGVYDIKNIKLRLIQEGLHTPATGETTINNSPWNIAADFKVDMSFSATEIETMLVQYEQDHQTDMNISDIAAEIYYYTGGYPVLVSSICKYIDEELEKKWDVDSVRTAVKLILKEDRPLFQSLIKNLQSNADLSNLVYDILMVSKTWSFTFANPIVSLGVRYGYFKDVVGKVNISNKIFELWVINYFVSRDQLAALRHAVPVSIQSDIISDGKFNMQMCLEKFAKYYHQHYSGKDLAFLERESRYFFLFFLNPILNGHGFAHTESAFTDDRRMDVVVNYLNQQFIVELKIWHGEQYQQKGFDQLKGYMDKMSLSEGYLLTFDFRQNKQQKQEWLEIAEGQKIFSIVV
ncbi:MAG: AAA-like domain-containing protein [Turicibacter sp.]|nr:AAA-like domain-containing protein [Turicibacter sp.]